MKLLQGTVLSLSLILSPITAQAALPEDGNELLSRCADVVEIVGETVNYPEANAKALTEVWQVAYCTAWIDSSLIYLWSYGSFFLQTSTCFPTKENRLSVTSGQGVRILVKYLKDHPKRLHEHPTILTNDAFREAFPCPVE